MYPTPLAYLSHLYSSCKLRAPPMNIPMVDDLVIGEGLDQPLFALDLYTGEERQGGTDWVTHHLLLIQPAGGRRDFSGNSGQILLEKHWAGGSADSKFLTALILRAFSCALLLACPGRRLVSR